MSIWFGLAALLVCMNAAGQDELVVCDTIIQGIAQELLGDTVSLHVLIPPGLCPGHYDVKPSELEHAAQCRAIILQPWQRNMTNIRRLLETVQVPEERIKVIDVPGSWMTPAVYAEAVRTTADIFAEIFPERSEEIQKTGEARARQVIAFDEKMQWRLKDANLGKIKTLCNEQQAAFAQWLGLDTAVIFGRSEELSVAEINNLIRQARDTGVVFVIDNLQSGDGKLGETLAKELNAAYVMLSNFPGAFSDTSKWEDAVRVNVNRVVDAINQQRHNHE